MLDSQTRRDFVHIGGMMGSFEAMKNKVTALANDCGHAAMDIGLLARDEEEDRHQSNPMGEQERIALDIAKLEKRKAKPETICWHCNEKGHV